MTTAETSVTAAYLVFLGVVLLYVVIYSFKIAALERAVAGIPGQRDSAHLERGSVAKAARPMAAK